MPHDACPTLQRIHDVPITLKASDLGTDVRMMKDRHF